MLVGGDDGAAVLEMVCSEEVVRHVGVDVEQSVTDDEQNSFQLQLSVTAHCRHR